MLVHLERLRAQPEVRIDPAILKCVPQPDVQLACEAGLCSVHVSALRMRALVCLRILGEGHDEMSCEAIVAELDNIDATIETTLQKVIASATASSSFTVLASTHRSAFRYHTTAARTWNLTKRLATLVRLVAFI